MEWQDFQLYIYELTEDEVTDVLLQMADVYASTVDSILKAIEIQYSKVLAGVDTADFYNEMVKYDRLDKLLAQITTEYSQTLGQFNRTIINTEHLALSNTYYRKLYADAWLDERIYMTVLPPQLIELSIYGTKEAWKEYKKVIDEKVWGAAVEYNPPYGTIADLLKKTKTQSLIKLQDTLTSGLLQGQSYDEMTDAMYEALGSYAIEGDMIETNGILSNLMRIARTETNRVMNDAAFAAENYAESLGVDIQKMWLATLDSRTRVVHGKLDKQKRDIDKPFDSTMGQVMRPGQFGDVGNNVNCRCTVIDIINDEEPTVRRGRNPVTGKNEVMSFKSFDEWVKENGLKKNKYGMMYFDEDYL